MSTAEWTPDGPPILSLRGIHKAYGGVVAIEKFDLDVNAGEVVALVGDNGAGKSTLIKVIAGVEPPTSGRILVDGVDVVMKDPSDSQALGIQVVYQDLALADSQPVYMNLFLGKEITSPLFGKLDRKQMIAETESAREGIGYPYPLPQGRDPRPLRRSASRGRDRPGDPLGEEARFDG